MVTGDSAQQRTPEDVVAILTRGGVVWSPGPRRVTLLRPCTIDPTGVALYRWPMWSVFIPLERVERFDVVWVQGADGRDVFERLVLLTRDGKTIPVQARATQWLSGWHGLPLRACAQQLNNHLFPTLRAAKSRDGESPPRRIRRRPRLPVRLRARRRGGS